MLIARSTARKALAILCCALLALHLGLSNAGAQSGSPNPKVVPPTARYAGATYGEWGVRWWKWAYSIPVSLHPLFDTTGDKAANGQAGPVFFLGGVFNESGTAERSITVPAGKALFFPIMNVEWDNIGTDPPNSVDTLFAIAKEMIDSVTGAYAVIDGRPVANLGAYRATSPGVFSYSLPDTDNIYQFFGLDVTGTISPAVSDGYWLLVSPLSVGQHTISFGGTAGDFSLAITYHITVTKP